MVLYPCADPLIFVRGGGGGGGGPGHSDKKALTTFFYFSPQLIYRSQMVNFIEINHFSWFQRGSNTFQGGGGGLQLFPGGGGGPIAYSL